MGRGAAPWLEDVHLRALECDAAASLGIGGSERRRRSATRAG